MPQNYWNSVATQDYSKFRSDMRFLRILWLAFPTWINAFKCSYCTCNAIVLYTLKSLVLLLSHFILQRIVFFLHSQMSSLTREIENRIIKFHVDSIADIHIEFIKPPLFSTSTMTNHIIFTIESIDPWSMSVKLYFSHEYTSSAAIHLNRNRKLYNLNLWMFVKCKKCVTGFLQQSVYTNRRSKQHKHK